MQRQPISSTRLYISTEESEVTWLPTRYVLCDELIQYSHRGRFMSWVAASAAGSKAELAGDKKSCWRSKGRSRSAAPSPSSERRPDSSSSSASPESSAAAGAAAAPSPPLAPPPSCTSRQKWGRARWASSESPSQLASAEWYTIVYVPSLLRWPTRPPYHAPPPRQLASTGSSTSKRYGGPPPGGRSRDWGTRFSVWREARSLHHVGDVG